MKQNYTSILEHILKYVSDKLKIVDAGHNMSHVERVLKNAKRINELERGDAFLIEAGVLLHDVTDEKLFDKTLAEQELKVFLHQIGLKDKIINCLFDIINSVSFGAELDGSNPLMIEQKVVRDADRLDAMGAIGIARAFHYGGGINRQIFDPTIPPQRYSNTQEYRKSTAPTINHFYEKLLLLKDRMETPTGKSLAVQRHQYMIGFLNQFYDEMGEEGFKAEPE